MASNPQIKAVITAEDRASATLNKFGQNVNGVSSKISKGLKVAAVGVAAAATAAVAFGVSSVKSFQESENAVAQLNAVLKSTKGVAGVTAKAATNLANSLQKVTKYSDEDVMSAESLLLTFTKIGKDIFPQATKTVLDMSTALGQDTKASAIQLGKALQDPILGVTALRRVGVNFSKDQQEVIKKLVETGKSAEAQRLIMKELNTEFGGSAEAAGKTFSGRLAILKNQFDEIKESIGLVIINALTPLMTKLAEFVASDQFKLWLTNLTTWLQVNLPIAINYVTTTLIPNLVNAFDTVWPVLKVVIDWLGKFINYLSDHEVALWTFIGVIGAMKVAFFMDSVVKSFQGSMKLIAGTYKLTSALLSTPILITIAIGAALIALELIRRKANETWDTINNLGKAVAGMKSAQSDARARLERLAQTGTKEQRARANSQLQKGTAAGSFATGGFTGRGGANELAGVVHKGEYVLPKNMVDQNTGTPKSGGSTTINISVPMMTGSATERRKVARMLIKDIQDLASMNGKGVTDMLTSNYGLIS